MTIYCSAEARLAKTRNVHLLCALNKFCIILVILGNCWNQILSPPNSITINHTSQENLPQDVGCEENVF